MLYIASAIICVAGIYVSQISRASWVGCIGLAVLLAVSACLVRQHRWIMVILSACALGLMLMARTSAVMPPITFHPEQYNQHTVTLTGRVINNPQDQNSSMNILLDQISVSGEVSPWYGQVQLNAQLYTPIGYGDRVKVSGKFQTTHPASSSYDQYLYHHQTYGTIAWPSVQVLSHNHGQPLVGLLYNLGHSIEKVVIRIFPKDEAGLFLGIVLGLQQPLSQAFSEALNNTSTTHIIVASGYNATIIIATTLKVAHKLKRSQAIVIALLLLMSYVALSGFNPSMIRAAIMATIAISAQLLGRQKAAVHMLCLTALAMLLISPLWIFDTSFQLSFAATIGVILFEPIISSKIKIKMSWLEEIVCTSLAAQVLTLPIISGTFGTIALLGIVANILILWLVPWVMLVGAVCLPLLVALPNLGRLLVWGIEPWLWYIKHSILFAAHLPLASIHVQVAPIIIAIYYVLIMVVLWRADQYEPAA